MPYKEKDTRKLYYTIGEVSAMFGVNASLIRYYEQEFDIIKPHKNKKGNRLFTQQDIDQFSIIFDLVKEKGHSLTEAKEMLKTGKHHDEVHRLQLVRSLKKLRDMLQELGGRLQEGQ